MKGKTVADNKPKRFFNTPRFRKSLDTVDPGKAGIVLSTLYRYRTGAIPVDFGAVLETHPLTGFDLAADFIMAKIADNHPARMTVATLLELARSTAAGALAPAEICAPDTQIAA